MNINHVHTMHYSNGYCMLCGMSSKEIREEIRDYQTQNLYKELIETIKELREFLNETRF